MSASERYWVVVEFKRILFARFIAAAAISLIMAASGSAYAAKDPKAIALSPEDRVLIGDIETYLNGITTLEAGFIQVAAGGGYSKGRFYMKRPGRMRFEYNPPTPYLLISNGKWFIYVDKQLEQVTYLPLKKTPAGLLLRKDLSFSDGLTVVGFQKTIGTLEIRVADQKNPDLGQVSLTFIRNPLSLKSWTIHDPQGQRIQVTLTNPLYGSRLDAGLFRFVNTFDRSRD